MEVFYLIIYMVLGALLFSLFDYFGFNISLKRGWAEFNNDRGYRVVQAVMQGLITLILLIVSGWKAALGFNMIWWTWGCDFIFYLYCEIFNYGKDRGNFRKEVISGGVQWAWWTPYGLLFTKKGDVVGYRALAVQALIGFAIALAVVIV